jgi:hypothetical protein
MFIADHQISEVRRHLPRVAEAAGVDPIVASRMFESTYLPLLHQVKVSTLLADHPLVNAVRSGDTTDVGTAQLAVLLGTRVITDNKAHFEGIAIQHDWLTVVAAYADASSFDSANAGIVVSVRVTGQGAIAAANGVQQGIEYLMEHPRMAIGVGLGALVFIFITLWLLSDDDRRTKVKAAFANLTPKVSGALSRRASWYATRLDAATDAEPVLSAATLPPNPLRLEQELAQILAAARWPVPTKDLIQRMRNHGEARVVAALNEQPAFVKQRDGWTLGTVSRG